MDGQRGSAPPFSNLEVSAAAGPVLGPTIVGQGRRLALRLPPVVMGVAGCSSCPSADARPARTPGEAGGPRRCPRPIWRPTRIRARPIRHAACLQPSVGVHAGADDAFAARHLGVPRGLVEHPFMALRSRPPPSCVHIHHGRPRDIVHIPIPNRHRMGRSLLAGMAVLPGNDLPVNVPCQRAAECRDGRLPGHPDSPSQGPRVGGRPLELADGRRPVTRRRSAPDDAGNLPGSHVHPRFRDVDSLGSLLIS